MLIGRIVSAVSLAALTLAIVGIAFWDWSLVVLLVFGLLYALVKAYGSAFINSNFYIRTLCSGDRNENTIAITFDDGPKEGSTDRILKILKEKEVKATFFCIGENIAKSESLARQINAEGHLIGNHSFHHGKWFDLQSSARMSEELMQTDEAIRKAINKKPMLFRPPYGVTNPNLARSVRAGEYQTIGWSVRSFDTVTNDKEKLWKRITGNLKGGDVILFHDRCEITIEMLPAFIDHASKKGLKIAPLDQVLKINPYA